MISAFLAEFECYFALYLRSFIALLSSTLVRISDTLSFANRQNKHQSKSIEVAITTLL
jgi:hypothetical protein